MRKKNHLTFRDDLSTFDNFFQSTFNDCNSSTFNMVIGQSDLYGNMKPHNVDISHTPNALACKPLMTVSGQKSKNVFVMESNAVSLDKPPTLNLIQNNLERMRHESQPVQVGPCVYLKSL